MRAMTARLFGDNESAGASRELGDFTATPRLVLMSFLAALIGVLGAFVALARVRSTSRRSSAASVFSHYRRCFHIGGPAHPLYQSPRL
jgi:hypothetical protein